MEGSDFPRLHFKYGFDEPFAADVRDRGWLDDVSVEIASGATFPVCFYDPIRLSQDLEAETQLGRPCIVEKNLVILKEITLEAMEAAVGQMAQEGFFG